MDVSYNGNIVDRKSGLSEVMPCQLVNIYRVIEKDGRDLKPL